MAYSLWLVALLPNAWAAESFNGRSFWIGDPHAHTGISGDAASSDFGGCDECGVLSEVFVQAREQGLDWVAFTDHVNGETDADPAAWERFQTTNLGEHDPAGGLVTVPAAEVWLRDPFNHAFGHVSFLAFGDNPTWAGIAIEEVRPPGGSDGRIVDCQSWWAQLDELSAVRGPVVSIPHHPAHFLPAVYDWDCFNPRYSPAVEVYSEHGTSMGDGVDFDPPWSTLVEEGTVHAAMDPDRWGHKMGFIAGTDGHDSRPGSDCDTDRFLTNHPYGGGLTMVVTEEGPVLDRLAIHRAMMERQTYATSGPAMPAIVSWSSAGAALGQMGEDIGLPLGQSLHAQVEVPETWAPYLTMVELVSPDSRFALEPLTGGVWAGELPTDQVQAWVYVAIRIDGAAAFGDTCPDGGSDSVDWAWLSPSWISPVEGDLDADGFAALNGDCNDGDAALFPDAPDAEGDGIDQNCDGVDGTPEADRGDSGTDKGADPEDPPCGCSAGGSSSLFAAGIVVAMSLSARRQRSRERAHYRVDQRIPGRPQGKLANERISR